LAPENLAGCGLILAKDAKQLGDLSAPATSALDADDVQGKLAEGARAFALFNRNLERLQRASLHALSLRPSPQE
jgi:hypothetical protein